MPAPSGATLSLPPGLRLRSIVEADLPLLERVYASTRTEELAQTDWDDAQKAAFLHFQFHAQHQHYITHYADAEFFVIERDDAATGRLYLHWRASELRIVDIALLPEHRGAGIGSALLHALIDAAAARGAFVSIHVEKMNRAMALYYRLGFRKAGEHGVYDRMERHADAA
ncbi:GNAT family N-acetyltransferase [Xanthomonadaceae bacterium JHOS43]|nr:GNAT family N-acetyltransferase [Xanthomonadaceae bacterium JHOS43]